MEGISGRGINAQIRAEEYRYLDKGIFFAAREGRVARTLLGSPLGPLGLGDTKYTHDTMTEMGDAIISMQFEDHMDGVDYSEASVIIPLIQENFFITRRNLAASRKYGRPLDNANALSAAYKILQKEETYLLQGWTRDGTTYEVEGLEQKAGNSYTTSKDFGTPGNPIAAVSGAMALLRIDNILPPYNLILYPTQYQELVGSIFTGGVDEFKKVKEMIGGEILASANVTTDDGILMSTPGRGHYQLIMGQDLTTEYYDREGKGTFSRVYEALGIVVYDANSICTITNI